MDYELFITRQSREQDCLHPFRRTPFSLSVKLHHFDFRLKPQVSTSRGVAKNDGTLGEISWWYPLSAKISVKTKKKKVVAAKRVGLQSERM